jgi:peptidoglycan/xylan/chitin deacetylase (PgdA/CDA1 family)
MRHEVWRNRLALRIDVDFVSGLQLAVPFFLDQLRAAGMHATFFVVAGTNRPQRSLRRLLSRAYRRRLRHLGVGRLIARVVRLGSGRAFLDSEDNHRTLRRIVDEGHELAVHGYDHAWWADHAWSAEDSALTDQIDRAFEAMRSAARRSVVAWGSPNWRTTSAALRHLHGREVPYLADCWGTEPFLTRDGAAGEIPVPHLPITLSSLETLILEQGRDDDDAVPRLFAGRPPDRFDMVCLHDYFEGLLRPELFRRFLETCAQRELETITLLEASRRLAATECSLPRHALTRAPLPGFVGDVSWQGARH